MTAGHGISPPAPPATSRAREQSAKPALRGDIEGLRAVAVLLVLLYHLGVSQLSGGFAGVDVFFVISGFLITSHLLSEGQKYGRVRLGKFYARRARRLLPAATLVLVFTAVVGYLVLPVTDHRNLSVDVALATVYVVNWGFAHRAVDYLAEDAGASPLQHYWSLSVEEQFYLVVPLLVLILAMIARRQGWSLRLVVGIAVTVMLIASFWYSISLTASDPARAYFVTPTRVWELAVGSLLACLVPVVRRFRMPVNQLIALAGAILLIYTAIATSTDTPWPGTAALYPVLGTALLIMAGTAGHRTAIGALLSLRPMVWVGGLSYAIYLWHWPLIVFAQARGWGGWHVSAAIAAITVVLSVLSRRLVEDPIRFGSLFSASTWRGLLVGAIGMALSLGAALAVWSSVPGPVEQPEVLIGANVYLDAVDDDSQPDAGLTGSDPADSTDEPDGSEHFSMELPTTGPVVPTPSLAEDDIPVVYSDGCQIGTNAPGFRTDCVYGDPDGDFTVALIGDSKAAQWFSPLEEIALAEGWRLEVFTRGACGVNPAHRPNRYPECTAWVEQVIEHLTSDEGAVDLVITSAGSGITEDLGVHEAYVDGYEEFWSDLQDRGTTVVAVLDNPYPDFSQLPDQYDTSYACVAENLDDWSVCEMPVRHDGGSGAMVQAADRVDGVVVIDLNEFICPDGLCFPVVGEVLVFRQGTHITDTYARSFRDELWKDLAEAGIAQRYPGD